MVSYTDSQFKYAQRAVGLVMVGVLAVWWVPYVSGVACNEAEKKLINVILKKLNCQSAAAEDSLYWFFRKKMLLLNIATYIPFAGAALQLFEVYAIGQFILYCVKQPGLLTDEDWMKQNWATIANESFSGAQAIRFFEQSTGKVFPAQIAPEFSKTVGKISKIYRASEKVPGLSATQEVAGEGARRTIKLAKAVGVGVSAGAKTLFREFRKKKR